MEQNSNHQIINLIIIKEKRVRGEEMKTEKPMHLFKEKV